MCRLSSSELEPLESVEYSFARLSCFLHLFVSAMFRLFRAVARFFVTGVGGGALSLGPKARTLLGDLGVSSPRKFSDLEALKRYF